MSRFGRKETFIASHYAHGFPASPVGFHPIQPLNWGPYVAYGNNAYGLSSSWIPGARWTRSDLSKRQANVSTYDHYDAVYTALRVKQGTRAEAFPAYSSFTALASNDSAALLKSAYWLAVAGVALNNPTLKSMSASNSELGLKSGVDVGAAARSTSIIATYDAAARAVETAMKSSYSEPAAAALAQLKKGGSQKAVDDRVQQAKTDTTARAKAEEDNNKPEVTPCESSTLGKLIPGYCTYQTGMKVAAGLVAAGTIIIAGKFFMRSVRGNPSAPGNMTDGPEMTIAMLPRARKQEQALANTTFRRRNT
jgi:hypothetical protein